MRLKRFALPLMLVITTFGIFATAEAQNGDAARGAKLFAQNCAVCHGDRGQGRVGATLAKDFPGIRVDLLLKDTISTGVKGSVMPAWAKANGGPLTDAEIDDLVAFVRSLGNIGPTVVPITLPPTRPATAPTPRPNTVLVVLCPNALPSTPPPIAPTAVPVLAAPRQFLSYRST